MIIIFQEPDISNEEELTSDHMNPSTFDTEMYSEDNSCSEIITSEINTNSSDSKDSSSTENFAALAKDLKEKMTKQLEECIKEQKKQRENFERDNKIALKKIIQMKSDQIQKMKKVNQSKKSPALNSLILKQEKFFNSKIKEMQVRHQNQMTVLQQEQEKSLEEMKLQLDVFNVVGDLDESVLSEDLPNSPNPNKKSFTQSNEILIEDNIEVSFNSFIVKVNIHCKMNLCFCYQIR